MMDVPTGISPSLSKKDKLKDVGANGIFSSFRSKQQLTSKLGGDSSTSSSVDEVQIVSAMKQMDINPSYQTGKFKTSASVADGVSSMYQQTADDAASEYQKLKKGAAANAYESPRASTTERSKNSSSGLGQIKLPKTTAASSPNVAGLDDSHYKKRAPSTNKSGYMSTSVEKRQSHTNLKYKSNGFLQSKAPVPSIGTTSTTGEDEERDQLGDLSAQVPGSVVMLPEIKTSKTSATSPRQDEFSSGMPSKEQPQHRSDFSLASKFLNFGKKTIKQPAQSLMNAPGTNRSGSPYTDGQGNPGSSSGKKKAEEGMDFSYSNLVGMGVHLSGPSTSSAASAYDIRVAPPIQRPLGLDDYYIIRRVGKGGFANVFLVRLKVSTGRYFALKAIKKSEVVRLRQEKQVMNEKNILKELKHGLLVELYNTFQNPTHLFMIMEFVAGGDLFNLLRRSKHFTEPQAKFYVSEVLITLEYLHSKQVVYRDLKPENILLDSTGHIKLADFGFAKRLTTTTSSFCGTPDYIAVEIVASKPYSFPVDWWSLGVLIFELVSGKTPFRSEDSEGIYRNIQSGKIQWVPLVTGPIRDVCQGLLTADPDRRLGARGAREIKAETWFHDVNWEKLGARQVTPPIIPSFAPPEKLELERATKGGGTDYREMLQTDEKVPSASSRWDDPFNGVFKGF